MKSRPLPSQTYLQECFNYDPMTGQLFWKARPRAHFPTETGWKIFIGKFAGKEAFTCRTPQGYLSGGLRGKIYLAHRVIYKLTYGVEPSVVDHDDRDEGNNKLANLVDRDQAYNMKNRSRSKSNTSGVTGVFQESKSTRWRAAINVGHKRIWLGSFDDFSAAVAARKQAEIQHGFHSNHGT